MKTWSITIRPREDNFKKEWFDILKNKFDTIGVMYSMCIEDNNHIHIALDCEKDRQDKMREFIIRIIKYKPEDVQEKLYWLKVSEHNDAKYCHGYTQKDEGWYIGNILNSKNLKISEDDEPPLASYARNDANIHCITSMSDIAIVDCVEWYHKTEKLKAEGLNSGDYLITSINKLLPFAKSWVESHTELFTYSVGNEWEDKKIVIPSLRAVCVKLVSRNIMPFSLGRKIKKTDEVFFKDILEDLNMDDIEAIIESDDGPANAGH